MCAPERLADREYKANTLQNTVQYATLSMQIRVYRQLFDTAQLINVFQGTQKCGINERSLQQGLTGTFQGPGSRCTRRATKWGRRRRPWRGSCRCSRRRAEQHTRCVSKAKLTRALHTRAAPGSRVDTYSECDEVGPAASPLAR